MYGLNLPAGSVAGGCCLLMSSCLHVQAGRRRAPLAHLR